MQFVFSLSLEKLNKPTGFTEMRHMYYKLAGNSTFRADQLDEPLIVIMEYQLLF